MAQLLGVNQTDLRILAAVQREGALTAGAASGAAGLSLSATSTAIQRLVTAGLLVREPDPADQRRAVLRLTERATAQIDDCYGPIERESRSRLRRWSDDDLTVVHRFLTEGVAFQQRQAARLRDAARRGGDR